MGYFSSPVISHLRSFFCGPHDVIIDVRGVWNFVGDVSEVQKQSSFYTKQKKKCTYVSKVPESGPQPIANEPSDVIRTYKEYKTNHFPSLYRNSYSSENRSTPPLEVWKPHFGPGVPILSMPECEKPFPGIRRRLGSGAYLTGRVYEPISVVRRLFRDKNDMRKTCKTAVICDT